MVKRRGKILVASHNEKDGRQRILSAARALFGSNGFHQTPMIDLAGAADVSVGQIYRLFKSKEEIIAALVRDHADQWCNDMAELRQRLEAGELGAEQIFEEVLLYSIKEEEEEDGLAFDILAEAFRNPAVGETIGDMCARFREYIRYFACAANDRLTGEALDAAEELVLACLFGLGHRSLSRPRLDTAQTARRSARMIVEALRVS